MSEMIRTTEDAFLADIASSPDDDSLRLIYSDWLEDEGRHERAEFIRLQCEFARLSLRDPRRRDLRALLRGIYSSPDKERYLGTSPPIACGFWSSSYRRGFLESATFYGWRSFEAQAEQLLDRLPVERIEIASPTAQDARHLAESPLTERIRRLKTSIATLAVEDVLPLLHSPRSRNLTALDLLGGGATMRFGRECVAAIASSPHLTGLTELRLSTFHIGNDGVQTLARSTTLSGLRHLDLSAGMSSHRITTEGIRELSGRPFLKRLTSLNLNYQSIATGGAIALAQAVSPALETLHLVGCNISPGGGIALSSSPQLAGLAELWLGSNPLDISAVRAVFESPHLTGLTFLDLSRIPLDLWDESILRDSYTFANLESLLLVGCQLPRAGVEDLLSSPNLPRVTLGFRRADFPDRERKELRARFGDRIEFNWS